MPTTIGEGQIDMGRLTPEKAAVLKSLLDEATNPASSHASRDAAPPPTRFSSHAQTYHNRHINTRKATAHEPHILQTDQRVTLSVPETATPGHKGGKEVFHNNLFS